MDLMDPYEGADVRRSPGQHPRTHVPCSPVLPGKAVARSRSLEMTQPGHAFEQRGTKPGTDDTKGKGDLPPPTSICLPSPPASLLAPLPAWLSFWFSSGHPAAGLGERQMVAYWCHWNWKHERYWLCWGHFITHSLCAICAWDGSLKRKYQRSPNRHTLLWFWLSC